MSPHLTASQPLSVLNVTGDQHSSDPCVCRHSTEEPMELSEDERNELMKKESSRLLKTGHRVSYSPRKEKALKIYLDGGPAKDPGQDWGRRVPLPVIWIVWLLRQSNQAAGLRAECRAPDSYLNIKQRCEADVLSPSTLSPRPGSETLLCTIVYCTVKFKGKYESY